MHIAEPEDSMFTVKPFFCLHKTAKTVGFQSKYCIQKFEHIISIINSTIKSFKVVIYLNLCVCFMYRIYM